MVYFWKRGECMKHLLVVEDEFDIQELLQNYLEHAGYQVSVAEDGVQALELFHKGSYDLVLLDLMLPKIDGFGVCEVIRRESDLPILMLTALDSEAHQLRGFDLKIDDYITKPFSMSVLLKKIEAVLRRCQQPVSKLITYKELVMDLSAYQAFVNDQIIELTQREFDLLSDLLMNQGKVMSRQSLLNRVWGYDYFGDERIVDTHIKNIRKKLNREYIETIRGVGYRIDKSN